MVILGGLILFFKKGAIDNRKEIGTVKGGANGQRYNDKPVARVNRPSE